ncbi:hypothetical protein [Kitasatospora sp. NPDC088134]|uniref:hypothetical protein n=1 Tax=Kitasatospora sp. NPDC088134 TaxID=3364071 RepID=UPI0038169AE4
MLPTAPPRPVSARWRAARRPADGHGEIVVRRDKPGGRWAVTDGAQVGLRAWTETEGWRPVWDIGRAVAFRYTREVALALAHQVAEQEAANHQALLAVAADPFSRAAPTGHRATALPRRRVPATEGNGEPTSSPDSNHRGLDKPVADR